MKKYVLGLLFTQDLSQLVLIKKLNPTWQKGYYNGIGGKIEAGESSVRAMVREFKEETGVDILAEMWTRFAKIHRPNIYDVDVYFARSNLALNAKTVEQEQVVLVKVNNLPAKLIPNLKWLIPLALDEQADFSKVVEVQELSAKRDTV